MISNGIDLAEIKRFDELKNDPKFMNHFFLEGELEYIKKSNYSSSTIAGIYSAKEAFLKAIKKGINHYSFKDIEICHNEDRAPYIVLHNELENKYNNISLSISHDGDYAISIVTLID